VVNPKVDTAYYLKAEKMPGCFAYDTVRITVHHSPSIDLGADQSFCKGDSALFNAGGGFDQYLWSTGAATRQITVNSAGRYSVVGITAEGCKSYDTVRVLTVFVSPEVRLDHSTALCAGETRLLDAGSFSAYQWNDGSTARTFPVTEIGRYAVEVTDNNGCKGSDTAIVTTLLSSPSGFLSADTAICPNEALTLKPINQYPAYLWNNNASAASLTISRAGIYWLQVKDDNNCTGRDTIVVGLKECQQGFYTPTAFTPNSDGKNDLFRPKIYGNVKQYQLIIYNRWGEVIFQTTDLQKGWDGTLKGNLQGSSVFIWTCRYQLEGESLKQQKGTVLLVR
jgi:gliding motility-associated-like protein